MNTNWYQLSAEDTLQQLGVVPSQGLADAEAQKRLAKFGHNELVEKAGRTRWQIIREQLTGILTILLYVAIAISAALGDWIEAVVILLIVVLNAILGYTQEYRAEQSMAALKRMAVPRVRVRRDGRVQEISARELVPGDIVLLETGNIVPADGRVITGVNLKAEEAALTGESEAVEKEADLVFGAEKALGDRRNLVYSGTIINYGRGEIVVTATGMRTELGRIATLIQGVEQEETPLQERLDRLGKVLAYAALILVVVIFVLGLLRGHEDLQELLLTSVSLAVAAVPEAMTAVVTIALSLGAQRMLRRQALIRKLPAVETLGSVTVICSDKTGTLTVNRMTVTAVDIANHRFDLVQAADEAGFQLVPLDSAPSPGAQPALDLLLVAGALCNDAILAPDEQHPGRFQAVGDPTEAALTVAAAYAGISKTDLDLAFPRLGEAPFDSVRKRMTTLHAVPRSEDDLPPSLTPIWTRGVAADNPPAYVAFTKGAIDGILNIAGRVWIDGRAEPLDDYWRGRVMAAHDDMAAKGMRVLGAAVRIWDRPPDETTEKSLERDLIVVGLFGMIDPPRPEVRDAVLACRSAGIHPVMITGDHPLTARHIARQVGITDNDRFLTGQELDRLDADALVEATKEVAVFARVSPEHKLKLIDAFQRQNNIVAMTGDGVNDAPALKKSDIGVAMGVAGTDVAKGTADMVLLDDNFATIVAAVEEGRIVYDNIRRFIKYLLTCNTSEIAVMLLGPLLGMPLPLLPLQILWMNLVTDGLPALALGVEPAEKNVMKRPPYSATESVFGRGMVRFIIIMGIILSFIAITAAWQLWRLGDPAWQTVLFSTLVFSQLAVALGLRSEDQSLFKIGLFSNRSMVVAVVSTIAPQLLVIYWPVAQHIFDTRPLPAADLALSFGLGLLAFVIVEIWKWVGRMGARRALAAAPAD
ncbi:MAG: cation-translocating P-type ATPase [Caldilineales bacterium]|nr:cation-translocating P-type ATPase [Caldilineales bacterium]